MNRVAVPRVTILMSARERFSATQEVLDAVYELTDYPFRLVYVDGRSPSPVRRFLRKKAAAEGFELLRFPHYLWPNRARNIALSRAHTEYVVFLDNDTLVSRGWLEPLVRCADETGADVVTPLVCQYRPVHSEIHYAGGETGIAVGVGGATDRTIVDRMHHEGEPVSAVRPGLTRTPTGLFEFHCVLMRREVLERVGAMDERLLNTREHVDLCLRMHAADRKVYLEPASVVTYLGATPLALSDMSFYMLRWSDAWTNATVRRLGEKWRVNASEYLRVSMKHIGWRRGAHVIAPLAERFSVVLGGRARARIARYLGRLDKALNPWLTARYAKRMALPNEADKDGLDDVDWNSPRITFPSASERPQRSTAASAPEAAAEIAAPADGGR